MRQLNTYEVFINNDLSFIFEGVKEVSYAENLMCLTDSNKNIIAAFDITNVVIVRKL